MKEAEQEASVKETDVPIVLFQTSLNCKNNYIKERKKMP
jgi:hypothetical protein